MRAGGGVRDCLDTGMPGLTTVGRGWGVGESVGRVSSCLYTGMFGLTLGA